MSAVEAEKRALEQRLTAANEKLEQLTAQVSGEESVHYTVKQMWSSILRKHMKCLLCLVVREAYKGIACYLVPSR